MLRASRRLVLAGLTSACCATGVHAAPVVFTFEGKGSGDLGGALFTDAAFEVRIEADTEDAFTNNAGTHLLRDLEGSIDIDGIGVGAFEDAIYVFNNPSQARLGFGSASLADLVGLSGSDPGYDLTTSTVLFDASPGFTQFTDAALDIGLLSFTEMSDLTFEAVVAPEPSVRSMRLAALGLLALLGLARARTEGRSRPRGARR